MNSFYAHALVGSSISPTAAPAGAIDDDRLAELQAAAGRWRAADERRYRAAVATVCDADADAHCIRPWNRRPASRAYAKLCEILAEMPIKCRVRLSVHLGEAPGGFVQALADVGAAAKATARARVSLADDWRYVAVSLPPARGGLEWRLTDRDLRWCATGDPIDGDLLDNDLRDRLLEDYAARCQLVTADGGFEVDYAAQTQERAAFDLVRREFEIALALLDPRCLGATCVVKLFDTRDADTRSLVAATASCFDRAWIVKPSSSRAVNAERYFVGVGLREPSAIERRLETARAALGARQGYALRRVGDLMQ